MSKFFDFLMKKDPEVVDNPMVPTSEQSASVKYPVELYLKLTTICMQQAEFMTTFNNGTRLLRFNQEQCKYLARKLKIAVQSAQLFFEQINPWYTTCAPPELKADDLEIFKLLFALSKEVESFIHRCCEELWIQSAIMLTNVWRHIWSITFRLEFCTIVFNSKFFNSKVFNSKETTQALSSFMPMELSLASQAEAETVKEMADLDNRTMSMHLDDLILSISSRETVELATFLLQRLNSTRRNPGSKSPEPFQSSGHPQIMVRSLKRLVSLGKGVSGDVYKATWLGAEVALKSFRGPSNTDFQQEVSILAGLYHPNIVSLFWYVTDEDKCQIIMELMDKDLNTLMEERLDSGFKNHPPFTISETLDIILQVAEGVLFLHDMHIVHRDLKSYNILVKLVKTTDPVDTEHMHIKVSDFGLSRTKERSMTYSNQTQNVGTCRWMAPEVINIRNYDGQVEVPESEVKYPFKSDVYSFAMVCYEVLTGHVPFSSVNSHREIKEMVLRGVRPSLPEHCPSKLRTLIEACWSAEASTRPSFHQICAELRQMRYSHLTTSAWTGWANLVPRYFSKDEINTMTNDFSKRLDTASYREIYRGAMVDSTRKVVAVDRVSDGDCFNRKLEVLRGLYHDNVVRCVGFCNEEGETILLYDDMPTSTLSDWHEGDKRGVNHKWPARKRILFGVANGIHYLHSVPKLIHRAIHPDDILLNSNLDPKLTGFGWSIFQTDVVSSYDVRGLTHKGLWRAPEYDRGRFNEKVDVYSYGLVLFEIVSGSRVSLRNFKFSSRHHVSFSNKHLEQGWVLLLKGRTKELIDRTLNLGQHEYVEAARMMKIAFLCMHKEPERRPDMSVVLEMMLGNRDAEIESLVFHQN